MGSAFFSYAELVGFVAFLILVVSYQFKSTRLTLLGMCIASFVWAAHFFLMGQISGALVACVNTGRNGFAVFLSQRNIRRVIPLFVGLAAVIVLFQAQSWVDFVPVFATSFYAASAFMRARFFLFRACLLLGECSWMSYGFLVDSKALVIANVCMIISLIFSVLRHRRKLPIAW